MIKKLIDEIRKKGNYSFENIIENYELSDEDYFEFLKFLYIEDIPEVRTSLDGKDFIVLEDENFYVEEKEIIKTYFEEIKEKYENIETEQELIDKYLKVAVRESLVYSKYGFSFLDLVQEATLGVISSLNYYDKMKTISNEAEFFIRNFAIKYILEYQKDMLKNIKASELSYILFLKIQMDRGMGKETEKIAREMNVSVDYVEQLEKIFNEVEFEENIEIEEVMEKANKITQMYILENIPKKLSYIDEQILIMCYGLDGKSYEEKEIAKMLNIAVHNVKILKEKALNKLSIDLLKNEFTKKTEENDYILN